MVIEEKVEEIKTFESFIEIIKNLRDIWKNNEKSTLNYQKAVEAFDRLPSSFLEHKDAKDVMSEFYKDVFEFFIKEIRETEELEKNYRQESTGGYYGYAMPPAHYEYIDRIHFCRCKYKSAELAVRVVETTKQKLGLDLCAETDIEELREKAKDAKKREQELYERYLEEDSELMNKNYFLWRKINE